MPWKILIVDDDVDTCENLSDILTDFGHEICTAHNGCEALQRAAETRFDIVLLDLKMPDMDGLELYHELKRFSPTTVAILITGYADSETERRAAQIGVWRMLPKPLNLDLLLLGKRFGSLAKGIVHAQLQCHHGLFGRSPVATDRR